MDEDQLQQIHKDIVRGDPTASLELIEASSSALLSWLQWKWPNTQVELLEEAVVEAQFSYLNRPQSYDPTKGALGTFLRWSAHRDLQNILDKEHRQRPESALSLDRVEEDQEGRNSSVKDQISDPWGDPAIATDMIDPDLLAKIDAVLPDHDDRRIFELIVDGERRTEEFARIMKIDHLPIDEQRKLVKRTKDRVLAGLRRQIDAERYE